MRPIAADQSIREAIHLAVMLPMLILTDDYNSNGVRRRDGRDTSSWPEGDRTIGLPEGNVSATPCPRRYRMSGSANTAPSVRTRFNGKISTAPQEATVSAGRTASPDHLSSVTIG